MKTPTALFFGLCLVALAIIFVGMNKAESQARGAGFMVASDGRAFVWRVNTSTGAVSYCLRRDDLNDPKVIASRAPICSLASPAASN